MYNHRNICQNISMIIFVLIAIIVIGFLLYFHYEIHFLVTIENFNSHIEIHSLFFNIVKNGSFKLKEVSGNDVVQPQKQKKMGKNHKLRNWILKNIRYEEVSIHEEIGALTPFLTSLLIPMISTATMIPLHFLRINYHHFQYDIIPKYNNFEFVFTLKAKATLQPINLIRVYD